MNGEVPSEGIAGDRDLLRGRGRKDHVGEEESKLMEPRLGAEAGAHLVGTVSGRRGGRGGRHAFRPAVSLPEVVDREDLGEGRRRGGRGELGEGVDEPLLVEAADAETVQNEEGGRGGGRCCSGVPNGKGRRRRGGIRFQKRAARVADRVALPSRTGVREGEGLRGKKEERERDEEKEERESEHQRELWEVGWWRERGEKEEKKIRANKRETGEFVGLRGAAGLACRGSTNRMQLQCRVLPRLLSAGSLSSELSTGCSRCPSRRYPNNEVVQTRARSGGGAFRSLGGHRLRKKATYFLLLEKDEERASALTFEAEEEEGRELKERGRLEGLLVFVKEDEGRLNHEVESGVEAESEGGSEIPRQNLLLNFQAGSTAWTSYGREPTP